MQIFSAIRAFHFSMLSQLPFIFTLLAYSYIVKEKQYPSSMQISIPDGPVLHLLIGLYNKDVHL